MSPLPRMIIDVEFAMSTKQLSEIVRVVFQVWKEWMVDEAVPKCDHGVRVVSSVGVDAGEEVVGRHFGCVVFVIGFGFGLRRKK